jgi:hypothetical protein
VLVLSTIMRASIAPSIEATECVPFQIIQP